MAGAEMVYMSEESRMKKTVSGTAWSMVERLAKMGIQILCTFIIAQFVAPSEFGLVSMMSIFLAFSTILIDSGFSQALIHEQHVTPQDESSIFWFNVALGPGADIPVAGGGSTRTAV